MDMRKLVRKWLGKPIEILFLQDNPDEVRLILEVLRDIKVRNNLHVVMNDKEAIAFLQRQGEYRNGPRPDVILLDLNMMRKYGDTIMAAIEEAQESVCASEARRFTNAE